MTIQQDSYLIEWPAELAELGAALAAADPARFDRVLERFPEPKKEKFYSSDGGDDDMYVAVDGYQVIMPPLYYLIVGRVYRDKPPYDPNQLNNETDALDDEALHNLGVAIADEPIRLDDKTRIFNFLRGCGLRFDRYAIPFKVHGISANPLNHLLDRYKVELTEQAAACKTLVTTAVSLGGRADAETLLCLARIGDPWFSALNERIPESIKFSPDWWGAVFAQRVQGDSLQRLIADGRLQAETDEGQNAWVNHAARHRPNLVETLVKQLGHDINHRGSLLQSALHDAVIEVDSNRLKQLLELGADPNIIDETGNTPLHYAAKKGVRTFVETLLENGADPSLENNEGQTAAALAQQTTRGKELLPLLGGD